MSRRPSVPLVGARRVPRYDAPRQTPVSLRSVPCPERLTCGADVGEPCRSTLGNVLPAGHRSRRRIATRAHNAARANAHRAQEARA